MYVSINAYNHYNIYTLASALPSSGQPKLHFGYEDKYAHWRDVYDPTVDLDESGTYNPPTRAATDENEVVNLEFGVSVDEMYPKHKRKEEIYAEFPELRLARSTLTEEVLKPEYMEAIQELRALGVRFSYKSSYENVEGTDWAIGEGAEALIGHDILKQFETDSTSDEALKDKYGYSDPRVNEYGFVTLMPGSYKGFNFLDQFYGDGIIHEPTIEYKDRMGLGGLSFDERKEFLELGQSILDTVAPGINISQVQFRTAYEKENDQRSGIKSIYVETPGTSMDENAKIEKALNDPRLLELLLKSEQSHNQSFGEYKISVIDSAGNALPTNEIILSAEGRSLRTTVDMIKDMDHREIYSFIIKEKS